MTLKLFNVTINIKKETLAVVAVFVFIILSLTIYYVLDNQNNIIIDSKDAKNLNEPDLSEEEKSVFSKAGDESLETNELNDDESDEIKVYIIGCINNPGIITLKKGQMIYEAIETAGGLTEDADVTSINMVYELEENVMLNILPKNVVDLRNKEQENEDKDAYVDAGSGIQLIKDEGDCVVFTGNTNEKTASANSSYNSNLYGKININIASVSELDTLPGIGQITADSIVKYRQQYGKFKSIEDIMNVPGIKEGKFEKIKDFIIAE